jgi:anion-transporting  ArsA/GET3 family ATPase
MKKIYAIFAATALAAAMTLPAAAQDQAAAKLKRVQMREKAEKHPEIHAAIRHLQEAKNNLEHAAHDFGGHRAAALKHVNEALEECHAALAFDKK